MLLHGITDNFNLRSSVANNNGLKCQFYTFGCVAYICSEAPLHNVKSTSEFKTKPKFSYCLNHCVCPIVRKLVLVITWLRGRLQINFPTRFTKSEISRAKRGKFDFVNWGGKLICNLPSGMWLLVNPTQEHTWCYNVRFDVRSDENIDYFRLSVTNKLDEVEKSFTSQKTYVIESCLSANPAVISPKGLWLCNIRNINFVIIAVFDVIFVIFPAKKTFH